MKQYKEEQLEFEKIEINIKEMAKKAIRTGVIDFLVIDDLLLKAIQNRSIYVSISEEDISLNGSPKIGDVVCINPDNENDMWLVEKKYFDKHYTQNAEKISDGYHTFKELYNYRAVYNALLFNTFLTINPAYLSEYDEHILKDINGKELKVPFGVHKSWKHNDGEWCFGKEKEYFVVCAMLPTGLITNHYLAERWDLFNIPEVEKSIFKYDGHTPNDAYNRMVEYAKKQKI